MELERRSRGEDAAAVLGEHGLGAALPRAVLIPGLEGDFERRPDEVDLRTVRVRSYMTWSDSTKADGRSRITALLSASPSCCSLSFEGSGGGNAGLRRWVSRAMRGARL